MLLYGMLFGPSVRNRKSYTTDSNYENETIELEIYLRTPTQGVCFVGKSSFWQSCLVCCVSEIYILELRIAWIDSTVVRTSPSKNYNPSCLSQGWLLLPHSKGCVNIPKWYDTKRGADWSNLLHFWGKCVALKNFLVAHGNRAYAVVKARDVLERCTVITSKCFISQNIKTCFQVTKPVDKPQRGFQSTNVTEQITQPNPRKNHSSFHEIYKSARCCKLITEWIK